MTSSSSPPPDPDALARRFVELWQAQLAHFTAQPETAALMGRCAELMAPYQKFFSPEAKHDFARAFSPEAGAGGAAAAAASSELVARRLDEFGTRLDALAERIDAMVQPGAEKPRRSPRRAKSGRGGSGAGKSRRR